MGPIIILDKSALQCLSQKEIYTLFKHYTLNVPPILTMEILADLKKKSDDSMSEREVAILANKLIAADSKINAFYKNCCLSSLMGYRVAMTGQIMVPDSVHLKTKDGTPFIFIDESDDWKALNNWSEGRFTENDKLLAMKWRELTQKINLNKKKKWLSKYLGDFKAIDMSELQHKADALLLSSNSVVQKACLQLFMHELIVPPLYATAVMRRWKRYGKPLFQGFAPYAYHCFRANLFFSLGLINDLVTTRPTNLFDLEYLYYLPFCFVFCSGDKFHKKMAPILLRENQDFLESDDLKSDLKVISNEWEGLTDEQKTTRSRDYGSYPPENPNSVTHQLWVKNMLPWTPHSGNRALSYTPEEEKQVIEQLKPFMDAIDKHHKK